MVALARVATVHGAELIIILFGWCLTDVIALIRQNAGKEKKKAKYYMNLISERSNCPFMLPFPKQKFGLHVKFEIVIFRRCWNQVTSELAALLDVRYCQHPGGRLIRRRRERSDRNEGLEH